MADHDDIRRKHGYHALRVKRIVHETDDTRSYALEIPDELAETFRYRPGQFCTFRVHVDGEELARSYSMSSAPETDDDLTVTVKRVQDGAVSNWFNDHVAEADVLEVTKPAGVFCVRDGERPVVAFCGGSGVTPVMSIAKSVLAGTRRPVRMLYANRDRNSVIFGDELRALSGEHAGRFELRYHYDAEAGFPESRDITGFAKDSLDADFYICGPEPFMELVETSLRELGVDPGRILIERFGDGGSPAAATVSSDTSTNTDTDSDSDTEVPESVTLVLGGKKTTVGYQTGDTVLETARRGGLQPPFSCEAGNCATCMGLLRDGSVTMRANNVLEPDEVEEGWILTCQALPEGPGEVTVDYDAF
jgi:3-ketosteroid 9alpha-monooxygenase subunit B